MAQRIVTTYISDLSGKEADESIELVLDGAGYRVDVTSAEAAKLHKALAPYLEKGTRLTREETANLVRPRSKGGPSSAEREERRRVRTWAQENGYDIGDRGRISQEIRDAYAAAH